MKTLLVICARKGSKRLRNKHWQPIGDKPLWSISWDTCLFLSERRGSFDTIVSSDDKKIIDACRHHLWGRWIFRPRELCGDKAPIHEVLQHAASHAGNPVGSYDAIAFIPANVPTITPGLISQCVSRLACNVKFDSVITVRTVRDQPEWMWGTEDGHLCSALGLADESFRVQDIPVRYVATGTVNVVRTEVLMGCRDAGAFRYLGRKIGYVLDEDAIEIHDKRDLELARAWMHWKQMRENES